MTEEQRERLTAAAFDRLTTARALHAAHDAMRAARERLQAASDAHDNAVDRHAEIEGEIARGITRGRQVQGQGIAANGVPA